jgi:DNA invertase Pin-like site-specific DNA recombinase
MYKAKTATSTSQPRSRVAATREVPRVRQGSPASAEPERTPVVPTGIYCRISSDIPGTGLGVERQRQDCEKLAAAKGWRVVATYIDNDISAYSGRVRPEYRRLLADIEDGTIRALVVWHLDRLHRQPKELESFIDLVERKGALLASVSGDHDLATPEGRLTARIIGAVARAESEHKSRRIKRKHLEMAQAGELWTSGQRPYGYAAGGMSIVPHEAEVIRDSVRRILAGESIRSICLDLNRKGEQTSGGSSWNQRALKRVLIRARNAGFRDHKDVGLVKGKWPAILEEQDWRRIVAILTDPTRGRTGPPRRYLLSGLLRCGKCGKRLVAGPKSIGRSRSYWCMPAPYGCGKISIVAGWVEEFVADEVIRTLQNPSRTDGEAKDEGDSQALEELARDRAQLEELAGTYGRKEITLGEWLAARRPIEARTAAAQASIVESSRTTLRRRLANEGTDLREIWPSMTVEKARAVIESVIDHIVVKPTGGNAHVGSSRLEPVWRD